MNVKKQARRVHFDELPSTSLYVKENAFLEDVVVTAEWQTGGMGTKGRSFSSERGGVYLTKLTHYENFPSKNAFLIMARAAVAVCETLVQYGLQPLIKWPNDVLVGGKKICGILIENIFSGSNISRSIVGIGLNVCNPLPDALLEIATTMQKQGVNTDVKNVTDSLILQLDKEFPMENYLSYLGFMGEEAIVIFGDERVHATLLSVDEEGGLWIKTEKEERRVTAAEVSLRFIGRV